MHYTVRFIAIAAVGLIAQATQAESALERAKDRAERLLAADRGEPSEILYVGAGGAPCDYADLDDALVAAAANAEIRIVTGTYSGPFVTGEKSLTIIGGYSSCTSSTPTSRATLTDNGASTVMTILSSDGSAGLVLRNLVFENGNNQFFSGGVDIRGGLSVVFRNVAIRQNSTSAYGGGLRVAHSTNTDGALVVFLDQSTISQNQAGDGGGIACLGTGGSQHVVIFDSGAVADNQAQNRGGGVFAENCTFVSLAGGFIQGIIGNDASSRGGGIYGHAGSQISLQGTAPGFLTPGNPEASAILSNNSAEFGGGVRVEGPGTRFTAIDADIARNTAFLGAAIDARLGAKVVVKRGASTDCRRFETALSPAPCSRIRNNDSPNHIVTLYDENTSAEITQTFIHGNMAGDGGSSAVLFDIGGAETGSTLTATIEGSVIHDNESSFFLFWVRGRAALDIEWSSVADNAVSNVSIGALFGNDENGQSGYPPIRINSSIVWQPGSTISEPEGAENFFFDCNIAHDIAIPGQVSRSLAADPLFVDPLDGNYHVREDSPAVDFCDESVSSSQEPDMDGEQRGVSVTPGTSTPFDAGADEALDRIFADRFSP